MGINLKISILVVASAIFFTACGGESPKEATEKFYNSLKTGDITTYKKYSTDSTQRLLGLTFAMGCFDKDLKQDSDLSNCMKTVFKNINSIKVVEIKENSETNAIVIVEETTKTGVRNSILELQKFENQWKVSIKK